MKVLHVLNMSTFSGAENVVCQIIKMFDGDEDFEMAYTSPDGPIREALRERNITFLPMQQLSHSELKKVIDEFRPDIIHGHDIRGAIFASRFNHNVKVIHTIHGNDLKMRKLSLKSALYRMSAKRASHIFWVSCTCLEQYKFYEKVKDKSSVLYNVIDPDDVVKKSHLDNTEYDYDAVFIGRIAYPKNPQKLIRVFDLVVKQVPNFRAAIIGTGVSEESVKQMVRECRIEKNVDFLGYMSNPYKVLSDSKMLVMTSDWEGTPMVALEAMALGKPIVSTPTDGMRDLVINNENGFCEDEEQMIADRIVQLITDKGLYEKLCENQRSRNQEINNIPYYKAQIERAYR